MLRAVFFGVLLLVFSMASAHAEGICDIDKRWAAGKLKDGDQITVRGRIVGKMGRFGGDDFYAYNIEDTCPIPATVHRNRPINCSEQVPITGKFDESWSIQNFGSITLWVKQVSCE